MKGKKTSKQNTGVRLASPGELVQCRFVKQEFNQSLVAVYYDITLRGV